jgi:hypothetical protein
MSHTSLERAERRLRAAQALVRDLEQAVQDEKTLALYTSTGSARTAQAHYERALAELEATPPRPPVVAVHLLPLPPARRVNPRPRFLRRG